MVNDRARPKNKIKLKKDTSENVDKLYMGRQIVLTAFASRLFSLKTQLKQQELQYYHLNKCFKDYEHHLWK